MKADNLRILSENGFSVPKFQVVNPNEDIDFSHFESELFAVRSNDAHEDGGKFSYAGQFLTVLNVTKENVKKAVLAVADSYKIRYYEKSFGIKSENNIASVIIQDMVKASYSGVIFTSNPKGILNDMVIVVGKGLGENVVGDKEETVTYHCYKEGASYKEGSDILFPEYFVKELEKLGKRIEKLFNKPMDIEFAIEDEKIYILQAREITSLDFNLPVRILDNSNIAESYPGVCKKLTRSFAKEVYTKIFTRLGRRALGKSVKYYEDLFPHMVDDFGGRMYYEISSWYDILRLLPLSAWIIPIWQKMLGVESERITFSKEKPNIYIKSRLLFSFLYLMAVSQRKMRDLSTFFKKEFRYFDKKIEKEDDPKKLYLLFKEMEEIFFAEWDLTLINDMVSFLSTYFAGDKVKKSLSLESKKPAEALNDLIYTYKRFGKESPKYIDKKKRYIKYYGDRTVGELKLETRTFSTNPESLDKLVEERKNLPLKRTKGKYIYKRRSLARLSTNNREISRLNRSRLFGLMRKLIDKIALKTVGDDIYHLSLEQIRDMIFHGKNFSDEINEEKNMLLIYENIPTIRRVELLGSPDIDFCNVQAIEKYGDERKDFLIGRGVSSGRVSGEIIKITDMRKVSLKDVKGKIIATYSTDPGWFLLLDVAKGILAERGSLLSHTAIVARELKKPAVVGIKGLMNQVQSGDIVDIDGNRGYCKIVKRS
ncbi:MAG: phosphoenolpyruvate synthase [Lachnoanaerobaculum sp.]|nr:phosphoenolpyruvate synthase [Lachnoanaerobaculum sp.]